MSEPAADAPASSAAYPRLIRYARPYWPWAAAALIGMLFEAAAAGAFTWLIEPMLDRLFVARDPVAIFWMPFALITVFVVRGIAGFVSDVGMARIGRSIVRDLRAQLFSHYQRLPGAVFNRRSAGELVSKVIYDAEQLATASAEALRNMILDGLYVVVMLGVMLWHSVTLTAYLLVLAPLTAIVWRYVGRRYRRLNHRIQGEMSSLAGFVEEGVRGWREVRIFGGEQREIERFGAANNRNLRLFDKVISMRAASTATIQIIAAVALSLIVFRATRPDLLDVMSPGSFMSLIGAMMVMLPSLKRLTTVQSTVQKGIAAAETVFAILDSPAEVDAGQHSVDRSRGELRFEGVHKRYPDADLAALEEVSLACQPGTLTALVGRSGSGKTTLASLVPRLIEPNRGRITLDGVLLADWRLADLRRQIAWVGQDVVLFDGTIADNIAFGALAEASRADIERAARAAHAMGFIESMPGALDAAVGEGGAMLSGGQRQRIAIARAILKDAPVLILDEATSALDAESEGAIQLALSELMEHRTVLVIAHRLSTIRDADQIVVLDSGRVVERGSYDALLAAEGMFAQLVRLQRGAEDRAGGVVPGATPSPLVA